MANALADVQATFESINHQYNLLWVACQTDAQRLALGQQYSDAQAAYQTSLGKFLDDGDATIAALSTQLQAANAEVANSVKKMGDISKVIDNITQAVTIGAKLVAAAGL